MYSSNVLVNAFVKLDESTAIDYEVYCDAVEFTFGGRRGNFLLQTDRSGLRELITKGAEALCQLHERPVLGDDAESASACERQGDIP
jgi:hypothetical protein